MSFVKCDTFVASRFVRFVHRAFPVAPAAHLAAVTNQSLRAAERQLAGEVRPNADAIAACIAAFGPAFVAQVFNAPWASDAEREQHRIALLTALSRLQATGTINQKNADQEGIHDAALDDPAHRLRGPDRAAWHHHAGAAE